LLVCVSLVDWSVWDTARSLFYPSLCVCFCPQPLITDDPSFHPKRTRTQSGDLATVESIQYKLMTEEERERAKRKTAFTG
jgi:hypothetical protein